MISRKHVCLALSIPLALLALWDRGSDDESVPHVPAAPRSSVPASSARAPLFIENRGQWPDAAKFVGTHAGMLVRAEKGALGFQFASTAESETRQTYVRLVFEGALQQASIEGVDRREAVYSYFLGNDPAKWVSAAPSFDAVRYEDVYEGVDLMVHASRGKLEYDLHLAPGVEPLSVRVRVEGARELTLHQDLGLIVRTELGDLEQAPPRCFQKNRAGEEVEIACSYRILDETSFTFDLGAHDPTLAVLVDPELTWSTYFGSSASYGVGDLASGVAVGPGGDVFVTGSTETPGFPTTPGAVTQANVMGTNVFVARMRASDGALLYSSLVGGTLNNGSSTPPHQRATEIRVDAQGRATLVGFSSANDFPTTPGALKAYNHGPYQDAFVFRLGPYGDQLVYSTLLGGRAHDWAWALALAPSGAAIVGGIPSHATSTSSDFPTTPGALQTDPNAFIQGFIARLDPTGSFLEWSTLFAEEVRELAIDQDESLVIAGIGGGSGGPHPPTPGAWAPPPPTFPNQPEEQIFVARLEAAGNALRWVSLFGGSNADIPEGIALDHHRGVIVAGTAGGLDFPTSPEAFQPSAFPTITNGFVVRLSAEGALVYSTYLGGTSTMAVLTQLFDVVSDPSGLATVIGKAGAGYPTTPGSYQPDPAPAVNVVVTRLSPLGDRLFYSTSIGGAGTDQGLALALGASRRVTAVGYSNGLYPTTPNAPYPNYLGGQTDAVITTFDLVLTGIELVGESTPSCLGPVHMNATEMPKANAPRFALYASGAPPLSQGWLLMGTQAASASNLLGVELWLDRGQPITRIPIQTDSDGYVETRVPLPPGTRGTLFAGQYLLRNTAACGGSSTWSASNAVKVTVQ